MMTKVKNQAILSALATMPGGLVDEILRLSVCRGGKEKIREIRLRREGLSSITVGRERVTLSHRLSRSEAEELTDKICSGALYAHRDSIARGFVSLEGGVRVGLCGRAGYDGGVLSGVSDMRSFIFRIPTGECDFADELYSIYSEASFTGMIIYSPPGVGKTTALRALALRIGGLGSRVAVVDERCEFTEEDYSSCEVDILRGYDRRRGIEIATRTLSPELIMIDELGADDGEVIKDALRCGIPVIATAHASSYGELMSKSALISVLSVGAFDTFVGICRHDGMYSLSVNRL